MTTFCDLQKRKVVDIALGRAQGRLCEFLLSLKSRERVQVVCIDMNSAHLRLVRQCFSNTEIVNDRFHVIQLVQHFAKVCKLVGEEHISYGRGGLQRLLMTQPPISSGRSRAKGSRNISLTSPSCRRCMTSAAT